MAVSSMIFRSGLKKIMMGDINLKASGGSTVQAQLCLDSVTPTQNTFDFRNDITGSEPGTSLADTLVLADPDVSVNGFVYFDLTDTSVTFETVTTGVVGGAHFFKKSGTTTTSPLICLNDFSGGNITANGSDIKVTITNGRVFRVTL